MNLTDLKKLIHLMEGFEQSNKSRPCIKKEMDQGFCVVVLDRGFILIGHLIIRGEYAVIKNARGLRKWTSGKGLEWHIENGKEDTVIDGKGTDRRCHISKLQNWAQTDESKW